VWHYIGSEIVLVSFYETREKFIRGYSGVGTDYGRMMTRAQIFYNENPYPNPEKKNPVKCMKILAFCRKNGLLMQNHELKVS
jgi:hypothetical protein